MKTSQVNLKEKGVRVVGRAAALAAVACLLAVFAGCNTTEGVGKDVKSLGKGIEETAHDAKN